MSDQSTFINRDSLWLGVIGGTLFPIIAYALFLIIIDGLVMSATVSQEWAASASIERTMGVLAISANIILIQLFNARRHTNAMRGLVFPTIVFIIIWFLKYSKALLDQF